MDNNIPFTSVFSDIYFHTASSLDFSTVSGHPLSRLALRHGHRWIVKSNISVVCLYQYSLWYRWNKSCMYGFCQTSWNHRFLSFSTNKKTKVHNVCQCDCQSCCPPPSIAALPITLRNPEHCEAPLYHPVPHNTSPYTHHQQPAVSDRHLVPPEWSLYLRTPRTTKRTYCQQLISPIPMTTTSIDAHTVCTCCFSIHTHSQFTNCNPLTCNNIYVTFA